MTTDLNGVIQAAPPAGIPHFAVPFVITGAGNVATVEQDSAPEIVQSVAMLCGTRPGTRFMIPNYGLVDPTFAGIDTVALQLAVANYEPRASVSVDVTPGGEQYVVVDVGSA